MMKAVRMMANRDTANQHRGLLGWLNYIQRHVPGISDRSEP